MEKLNYEVMVESHYMNTPAPQHKKKKSCHYIEKGGNSEFLFTVNIEILVFKVRKSFPEAFQKNV